MRSRRKWIVAGALIAASAGVGGVVCGALISARWYEILMFALFAINAVAVAVAASENPFFSPRREKRFDFFAFSANGGILANCLVWALIGMIVFYIREPYPYLGYSVYGIIAAALMLQRSLRAGFQLGKFQKSRNAWDRFEYERQRMERDSRKVCHCPRCGRLVYEDQKICENCGNIFYQDEKK